jgi:DNA-binding protein H-NS
LIAQALELLEQQVKELQEKQHALQQKVNQVNNDNKTMLDL